ncbi:hypothetical protein kac65v162_gp028 [Nodularia phage vB_NspS-kac65v162]|jgi:hypothetical protein|uniref:Uncharacterized protein n=5 Tax=Ravarandavirus TaxID=2843444 RepID=A0A482MLD0_9CAUD|nr:hypothetical protein HWC12_gp028 [Nodularia phage vB_NspS-kac65v151]YP_009844841.1 hypothetical protein HWC13_gp032 [Nodularia phage vB_NspS-kac68v161]QBQ73266.1 hypothetical protein kac65v161_gp028 [Nodularia phage vB_NspS-kac65v161]QBQ73472.1 hypothetical protein kac65v162_gp028 [Nodularia phage vB_NspS-kac65v162]QBQ73880.1 hypothetical protein kac68v162_gp032 [Nodularia phage vB_NspS-kac68v162]QBQ73060.1 hypothetical protein kac65v151_gp028 [Nodularia phage vB_NspS-kac65v151]QBQ73682.1 
MLYINFLDSNETVKSIEINEKDYKTLRPFGMECLVSNAVGDDYVDYFDRSSKKPKGEVITHNWQSFKNEVRAENVTLKRKATAGYKGRNILWLIKDAEAMNSTRPGTPAMWDQVLTEQ